MKKASLKDIAESLGVSKALVSLVLNGKGDERGINKQTQEKVRQKAKELNYIPNQYARGLRIGRTNTIGVIVPDISNVFYGQLCKAIEQEAYAKGYNLIISNTYEDVQKEKKLISDLINRNIDGLILASSFDSKNEIDGLRDTKFPLVLVDRVFDDFDVDSVSVSNEEGAKKAVKFLYDSGVKRPVCFSISPVYISSISERIQGYMEALKSADDAKLIQIPHDNIEGGVKTALDELKNEDYDGIFCVNNNIAKALIRELSLRGESLDEVKIISFDDIEIFDIVNPKISAIAQPITEIGKKAVNLLIDRFNNEDSHKNQQVVLDTVLIER
ncbi:LacI family transcriptional regulator [Paracrocinitomix mangrovi]|uniref:LacI family DNA-binding transcriptional regulator n=1 Tax=Paracrocinitomix mangrovi TaxID=2862509 RepID=UPI001C8CF621|nr:LacI family DNA-binding transcriptional regulator [Paracrocinitomix mangrovi]UKN02572.1 LacI family transcriptional regulator [Paracrocinitomix mangrovi]